MWQKNIYKKNSKKIQEAKTFFFLNSFGSYYQISYTETLFQGHEDSREHALHLISPLSKGPYIGQLTDHILICIYKSRYSGSNWTSCSQAHVNAYIVVLQTEPSPVTEHIED